MMPASSVVRRYVLNPGRQAAQFEKGDRSSRVRDCSLNDRLVWSRLAQFRSIIGRRFDINASPSCVVERETDRIDERIVRANVNVATALNMMENAPEEHILEVLR